MKNWYQLFGLDSTDVDTGVLQEPMYIVGIDRNVDCTPMQVLLDRTPSEVVFFETWIEAEDGCEKAFLSFWKKVLSTPKYQGKIKMEFSIGVHQDGLYEISNPYLFKTRYYVHWEYRTFWTTNQEDVIDVFNQNVDFSFSIESKQAMDHFLKVTEDLEGTFYYEQLKISPNPFGQFPDRIQWDFDRDQEITD